MRDTTDHADRLVEAMRRIYGYRMTTTSGGNLSIRDEEGAVWITPARVDKGALTREDIVRVFPDGTQEGRHPASSELPFHLGIYKVRPDLGAIVHAHPVAMVAFSICGKTPDVSVFAKSQAICGEVGFAPYALPGSAALGESIAGVFARGFDCVMLENHGVVVGGGDFQEAFEKFETLEFTAKTIIKASQLGQVRTLGEPERRLEAGRGIDLPEFSPGRAGVIERKARRELSDLVQRGYRQRLLISTKGSYSVRVGEDAFVITPAGADRASLLPQDFVLVTGGRREAGKRPSRATCLHRAIYAKHPDAGAIVNATPVNATAFAVSGTELDTRTIPESYVFLRDVRRIPAGLVYSDPEAVAAAIDLVRPVALIGNDGAMVVGKTALDAFDRLEVLEATAEAIINSRPLAPLRPMGDDVIAELESAFGLAGSC